MNKTIGNIVILILLWAMVGNGAINLPLAMSTVTSLFKTAVNAIPERQSTYQAPPQPRRQ